MAVPVLDAILRSISLPRIERLGGLATNWDVRAGVFPPGVVDDMFAAFTALLHQLAADGSAWTASEPVGLPEAQAQRRFNEVRTLARTFIFDFHDQIAQLPGATPARALLVKTALTYLDRLAHEAGNRMSLAIFR